MSKPEPNHHRWGHTNYKQQQPPTLRIDHCSCGRWIHWQMDSKFLDCKECRGRKIHLCNAISSIVQDGSVDALDLAYFENSCFVSGSDLKRQLVTAADDYRRIVSSTRKMVGC